MWNHTDLTVESRAPDNVAGDPSVIRDGDFPNQWIVYKGTDNHIHLLWWNVSDNTWNHKDLTALSRADSRVAGNIIIDTIHYGFESFKYTFIYTGLNGHIYELTCSTSFDSWNHYDLTSLSNNAPLAFSNPAFYKLSNDQHIAYRTKGGHIFEIVWDGQWRHKDLMTTGAPANAVGDPAGYRFDDGQYSTLHVVYRGEDSHIHELWWDGGWNHNDLTAASEAPSNVDGDPDGYTFYNGQNKVQIVVYRGTHKHIHELVWKGHWYHNDLTQDSHIRPNALGDPFVYSFYDRQYYSQRFIYRDIDSQIFELWWNGQWNHSEITRGVARIEGDPVGYGYQQFTNGNSYRVPNVIYRGSDAHIHQLRWSES
jgi:hypothetical protein